MLITAHYVTNYLLAAVTEAVKTDPQHWYKSPEWILVIVGVLTALVIGYQSWATMLAARATERMVGPAADSASAALLSAQAVINSERPWLFIEIVTVPANADNNDIPEHLGFSVRFRNRGKTPAEVVSFDQHPDCCRGTDDLPSPPKYCLDGQVMVHTRLVPPGETWCDPGESSLWPDQFLLANDWKDIRSSRKRFVYGAGFNTATLLRSPRLFTRWKKSERSMKHAFATSGTHP